MGRGIYSRNARVAQLTQRGRRRGQPHPDVLLHKPRLAAAGLCELETLRACPGKQGKRCFWDRIHVHQARVKIRVGVCQSDNSLHFQGRRGKTPNLEKFS